ncbi:MAG: hypothetical protein K0B87_02620 [Candidatus Syntrophosphaera sp.]|nr:hypothetical protein [Candidatus Syntrophosphaera sp.]
MIIFDDHKAACFYPLALNRSVGDLRCGILKLRQRLQQFLGDGEYQLWLEPRLQALYRERHPGWQINQASDPGSLFVNSRLMVTFEAVEAVEKLRANQCLQRGDELIAFRARDSFSSLPKLADLKEAGFSLISCELASYGNLSDLIHDNERLLRFDFEQFFYEQDNYFETEPGVTALNPYSIWIGENVELKPGVVLDASEGPIVLDEGVRVLPNAVIIGPAYIGRNSLIKVGAKIYPGSSIGPVCKIGGEVEGSIFQAFSNKQHDGFLGHSYVGEWVNIGADTNNSDLKNTYGNVGFYSYAAKDKVDSGRMFLGALIADHVKLGINASLNTGCVVGIGCNLWGSDLIADFIPDFSWGRASELSRHRFEAFCQTAGLVKQRRKLPFTAAERELYQTLYAELESSY